MLSRKAFWVLSGALLAGAACLPASALIGNGSSTCLDEHGQPIGCPSSSGGGGTQSGAVPTSKLDRVEITGTANRVVTTGTSSSSFDSWYSRFLFDNLYPIRDREDRLPQEARGPVDNKAAGNSRPGKPNCSSDANAPEATTGKPVIISTGEKVLPQRDFALAERQVFLSRAPIAPHRSVRCMHRRLVATGGHLSISVA